ncbi:hypothetical protein ACOSQ4_015512 [Xanthoceras sorbifolium]
MNFHQEVEADKLLSTFVVTKESARGCFVERWISIEHNLSAAKKKGKGCCVCILNEVSSLLRRPIQEVGMANRLKEEEKNERIIRGLLKLADNRRCINCNSLGPQYVCTNFWTFICTACSGIHREFTHRVKSISMAKFTSQEVGALQEGGNQRAKEIYLKEWDPQRQSVPDSSNVLRLREFIKHVYVDKRYTGERNYDKPPAPRVKMGDKEDTYQGGSRSPPYEDTYDRRYSERSSPGGRSDDKNYRYGYDERRSPGYEQESRQHGDYRRSSPARPEIVSDWRRDDRFGNGRKVEDRRMSDGDSKFEGRSPERTRDLESSSPPIVRPVREILGENVVPLRIIEPPKANGGRVADGFVHTQRNASSSSLGSTNENPAEVKLEKTRSLIDFDADPEPPLTAAITQTQQTVQTLVQPTTSTNDNNWASFDFAPEVKASQAPSSFDTLESVFSQLSVPASVPGQVSGIPSGTGAPIASVANVSAFPVSGTSPVISVGGTPISPFSTAAPAAAPVSSFAAFPSANALAAVPGWTQVLPTNGGNSFNMQHQPSLFPAGIQSNAPQFTPPVDGASSHQPWNLSLAQNAQGPSSTPAAQAPTPVQKSVVEVPYGVVSQPPPAEVKSTGRKELPQDLFAATYSSFHAPVPGWQSGPPRGMGFMQYNTAAPMPTPVQSASTNPFDFNNESPPVQPQTFPSMTSLQGALPNASPPLGLLGTSSLGTPTLAWMPPQPSPYPSAIASQTPIYASPLPPRAYTGPQSPSNMPPSGQQGVGGFGSEGLAFGFMNPDQQLGGRFSAPATRHPSVGGNPFG